MNNLIIKNLNFYYKKKQVLNNLNISLKEKNISVLLGLNGCGKTTVLKLITGLLKVKENSIIINNQSINQFTNHDLSKIISYVPQLTNSSNSFKVFDYLTYAIANSIKFYAKPSIKQMDEILKIAKEFSIEDLLERNMNQLSGGQLQMVYICSALVQNTPIIVLDEPLSALDIKNQYKVIELLKYLKLKGKTIILSCHNPNICLHLESNVFLMKGGKIINEGKASEIIKPKILEKVYGKNLKFSKDSIYNEITFK